MTAVGTDNIAAAPSPRDRVIPLRKSDLVEGLAAEGRLDATEQDRLRRFSRLLGAIFHYDYFEELERLRAAYYPFDPEADPKIAAGNPDLDQAYRDLGAEFVRVLSDANFIELTHDEITRAFAERPLVRVKVKAPIASFREVRMFRRGMHREAVNVPRWFGLRQRAVDVDIYDDVVLMVATRPDRPGPSQGPVSNRIRPGAVLFKHFRHIARGDLQALFPNVRVVMSLADQLTLGVPAVVGGIPILMKLASTFTVLFLIAGFYLGVTGAVQDDEMKQALAALSGLFALGAFLLRQWGNFHRQSLMHEKRLTDNIYYRNINNHAGIFNFLIGEAEEQESKETLLAYYGLLTAPTAPTALTRDALEQRMEDLLAQVFAVTAEFAVGNALDKLRRLDLLREDAGQLTVSPLAAALPLLEREWAAFFRVEPTDDTDEAKR